MKKTFLISLFSILFIISSSFSFRKTDYRDGIKTNVCKDLTGKVLVYTIFVDTKTTSPWTEYDIKTTLDSVRLAIDWITKKAERMTFTLSLQAITTLGLNIPPLKEIYLKSRSYFR